MLEVIRVKLMGWFQIRREQGIVAMEEHRILSLSFLMVSMFVTSNTDSLLRR
jgi:hypothetical protein